MADIAAIFHWSKESLEALDIFELIAWRNLDLSRWKQMNDRGGK
jgi:hypothetical protein